MISFINEVSKLLGNGHEPAVQIAMRLLLENLARVDQEAIGAIQDHGTDFETFTKDVEEHNDGGRYSIFLRDFKIELRNAKARTRELALPNVPTA